MTMSLLSARPIFIIDFVSETKRSPSIVSRGIRKSCGDVGWSNGRHGGGLRAIDRRVLGADGNAMDGQLRIFVKRNLRHCVELVSHFATDLNDKLRQQGGYFGEALL